MKCSGRGGYPSSNGDDLTLPNWSKLDLKMNIGLAQLDSIGI